MSTVVAEDLSAENPLVEGLERLPVHPTALVIFGVTGDLARRKLLPALYNLAHEGSLPERFELIGIARSEHSDEEFREEARESITRFSRRPPDKEVLDGLLGDLRYIPGRFSLFVPSRSTRYGIASRRRPSTPMSSQKRIAFRTSSMTSGLSKFRSG